MKNQNPIVKRVIEKFTTIQNISEVFVTGQSAQRGLLISGDAGTGKSHYVKQAFIATNTTKKVDYQKSKTFTAPALYAKLWENRHKGDVIVFDDCSLESLTGESFNKWVSWIKGGLELSKDKKMIGYEAATKNKLFATVNDAASPTNADIWLVEGTPAKSLEDDTKNLKTYFLNYYCYI